LRLELILGFQLTAEFILNFTLFFIVESILSKTFCITFSLLFGLIVTGCQVNNEKIQKQEIAEPVVPSSISPSSVVNRAACKKSYSPIIKDIAKLKVMLMNNGKITSDMTDAEVKIAINQYIKNKRAAFKKCRK